MNEADRLEINQAIALLRKGEIISFRGDVDQYHACDVSNLPATQKLTNGSNTKECVLLVDLESRINYYLKEFPEQASMLFEYAEKPLTIFFKELKNLPESISKEYAIGFRITKDPLTLKLAEGIRRPLLCIAAKHSSAQPAMEISCSTATFNLSDEKRMEIGAGGIFRFID